MRALRVAVLAALVAAAAAAFGVAPAGAMVIPSFSASEVPTCTGSTPVTLTLDVQNPPPVQQAADIVLVMDASGSIGTSTFNTQVRSSLESFVTWASPSPAGNHIAVVKFANTATDITGGFQSDETTINNAIATTPYDAGTTSTKDALTKAQTILFGPTARAGVPRIIIVETDGVWNPSTQNPALIADTLLAQGAAIFAVGVGSQVNSADLTVIAGRQADRVLSISDYAQLEAQLQTALTQAEPAAKSAAYQVTATPNWTISGATASTGTITNATATGFSWQAGEINSPNASTISISYTETYVGSTDGQNALASQALLSWVDTNGSPQQKDYSTATVHVGGCNRPPVANAGPDQSVALNGSHLANVTLDGGASSDPDGDLLTYAWSEGGNSLGSGESPTVPLGIGQHTITLTVTDPEGLSSTDDVVVDVSDPSPPVVTGAATGPQTNGWFTGTATVSFTVSDPESDVGTESADCTGTSVVTDTAGVTYTCTASSAGGTGSASVSVKRDATGPTIAFGGNAGTYHLGDTVNITCTATDATSGLASSTCPGASGAAYTFAGGVNTLNATATDEAGNSSSASTSFTVVVDVAGLCALIRQWSDNAGIANSLCVKIAKGNMQPFWNELAAQRGKHLPAAKADIILALSRGL